MRGRAADLRALLALAAACALALCAGAARLYGTEAGHKLLPAQKARDCTDNSDEVCSLPGLNGPPHVRMRAGYITVSEVSDRRLWYLVADREQPAPEPEPEAAQAEPVVGKGSGGAAGGVEDDEAASPVLLWLTGGPGCSSLDAFIYEHGPFKFSFASERWQQGQEQARGGDKQREVVIEPNPFSWTKLATVIYVDSPAGAGMSYSGRPDVDYHTNDQYTIADLVTFLQGLTERYPELATAPFHIAGESYAGVYVPLLADALVTANRQREAAGRPPLVQLQGYAVGNPVTDDVLDGNGQMTFAAAMGYVDPPTWAAMREACDDMFWNATQGSECYELQGVVKDELWDLNWYDVLDTCTHVHDPASAATAGAAGGARGGRRNAADLARRFHWPFTARLGGGGPDLGLLGAMDQQAGEQQQQQQRQQAGGLEAAGLEAGRHGGRRLWGPWLRHVAPCMDRRLALDWLNRAEVRAALHAAPLSVLPDWQPCSDVLYYAMDTADLVPTHVRLAGREGLRVLVYSGDHDMVVPHTGTTAWLYGRASGGGGGRLGRPDGPLRPWTYKGQVAGWTASWPGPEGPAGAGVRGLRYASVKGAGHMVPQSRPAEALALLRAHLYGLEL
ncbi:hypothetical protein HYH02_004775 [Chlamydomonas schloesseri]|uniref:Carboxypeptidase n=1 Tax=Chlamydomonas schloesseri TaxID=2026947 RepID=A0A836B8D5_9CHLO|nr:hypothetical protein HYH02_004775 [Chlamydomonas schloesseri]|eukprot:KAG2450264.1 hypothetical protein HYH02_004775 [Chlamydomonas schloesseri]